MKGFENNQELLEELKTTLSQNKNVFSTSWINKILDVKLNMEEKLISVFVPSNYVADQIKKDNQNLIDSFNKILGDNFKVSIIVNKQLKTSPAASSTGSTKEVTEKPVQKKTEPSSKARGASKNDAEKPFLNPKYTLDNFVPGDNSRYAYNIAKAIAANPSSEYNPFLIYSNVGLGKTHLVEAIGNEIVQKLGYKVMYVTCEYFINEFMKSISNKEVELYKNIYRNVDVLIIDDVQFLEGKTATQEALFNIFNSLKDSNKQMIFTSDRPVSALKEFHSRLSTRLNSGVAADLQPPEFEIRVAILNNKCKSKNYKVDDEIIKYIAENIVSNVRDLEACLNRLVAYSKLVNEKLTLNNAKNILKDLIFISKDKSTITLDNIINIVAEEYEVSSMDIRGTKKNKSISLPRHIAMYFAHTLTQFSTTEIGIYFGNRDHSTVLYSINKIESMIKEDTVLNEKIKALSNNIMRSSK